MKAAVHTRYGPPEVVGVAEVQRRRPRTTSCSSGSTRRRSIGRTAAIGPPSRSLVRLFSGLVQAAGARPRQRSSPARSRRWARAVTSFAAGDRVFGFDDSGFGAHAEYLSIAQDASVATIPADLPTRRPPPAPRARTTRWRCIRGAEISRGQRRAGQRRDRRHRLGGRPAAGEPGRAGDGGLRRTEHVALVRRLGADRVIDRTVEDFTQDRADLRRRPRRRRQEHVPPLPAAARTAAGSTSRPSSARRARTRSSLLVTPLLRGKPVLFAVPRHDQAIDRRTSGS